MIRKMLLAAACCLPLSGFAQKGFTIHGKAAGANAPAKAVLIYEENGKKVTDSADIHNGVFTFSGKVKYPELSLLYILRVANTQYSQPGIHGDTPRRDIDHLEFYVDNSNMTITVKDSVALADVQGSKVNDDHKIFKEINKPNNMLLDSIKAMGRTATAEERKDLNWQKKYLARTKKFQRMIDSVDRVYMKNYPNSFITLLLFKQINFAYNFNPDTVTARFAKLTQQQRESAFGKELQETINNVKSTGIGRIAVDFTESDPEGKKVSLSSFRGHYVLLDFWASWCGPCRAENPNYLKAYNLYKDKNFSILGVSLDSETARAQWLAAIKKDNLPWTQISELKGFKSKAAQLYSVNAIPTNYLIDPNGKIIGKNLRGDALLKKLETILK